MTGASKTSPGCFRKRDRDKKTTKRKFKYTLDQRSGFADCLGPSLRYSFFFTPALRGATKIAPFHFTSLEAVVRQRLRLTVGPIVASCAALDRLEQACCASRRSGVLPQILATVGSSLLDERHLSLLRKTLTAFFNGGCSFAPVYGRSKFYRKLRTTSHITNKIRPAPDL